MNILIKLKCCKQYLIVAKTMTMRNPHQTWGLMTHGIQALTRSCITELDRKG